MSSNTVAGDRRWGTARRGGMTVLGKVTVPKPLNLPSQRLENHGLDPNVEIVPRGTLSWGSRSSSSGPNAWVSSSLSPNADGGNTLPNHLSGRPSSGGTGARPSTAGSDKTHEPVTSVWGSNSRPSSASGTLASNQSSLASLRPRSAETRPDTSQLSRFAESVSESSVAWGPSSTAERLGVKSSKDDGFSLSSGDFPTLGSEKDQAAKNSELQDRSRPSSASGQIPQLREKDMKTHNDDLRGTVNSWRADGSRGVEDGIHPSVEKWQGEPQQYFNVNAPPQHFDAWRGPPMNAPGGVWYRGNPSGPAFGGPVAPGGFPIEPFPYYHHQIPPPTLAGSQPLPPPGSGPRGPHPQNGELYRPQIPDAYARPGVPFRPGFYPGPPGRMAFDGYYGPPMGYYNNEHDIPYLGMGAGPPVYNGYPNPVAPDIGNSHGRAGGRIPSSKTISEHVESDHLEDTQGRKRVPLKKNHNDWDRKGENWEDNVHPNLSNPGKSCLPMMARRTSEWGAEEDVGEEIFAKRPTPSENSPRKFDFRGHSSDSFKLKPSEGTDNMRTVDENWNNKSESAAAFPPQMPHLSHANGANSSLTPAPKDSSLMLKIEGLNAKFRSSDGRNDAAKAYSKDERDKIPAVELKFSSGGGNAAGSSFERTPTSGDLVPASHEVVGSAGDNPIQQVAVVSRTSYHGGPGTVDYRGKGKFSNQDGDAQRRKHLRTEYPTAVSSSELPSIAPAQDPNIVREAGVSPVIYPATKMEGDSFAEAYDSTDVQAQRAKMKELAKQRALQLQKEEEERTREQKAKALAKLEELNRRTQAGEAAIQKAEGTQVSGVVKGGQEDTPSLGEPVRADPIEQVPSSNMVLKPDFMERCGDTRQAEKSLEESTNLPLETSQTCLVETKAPESHSLPRKDDVHDAAARSAATQLSDGGTTKHKRTGYKHKQNNSLQKSSSENSVPNFATEAQKDHTHVAPYDMASLEAPNDIKSDGDSNVSHAARESSHQRKKSNRNKNKHKPDEVPSILLATSVLNPEKMSLEGNESKVSLSNSDCAVQVVEAGRPVQTEEAFSSVPNEEIPSRLPNQGKPHSSRRQLRKQHVNRFTDKNHGSDTVMWAPVRTNNKVDSAVEASQKSAIEWSCSTKTDTVAQTSYKGKRAEIERYVPKPIAKEQGGIPSLSSAVSSSNSDEPTGQSGSSSSASAPPVSSAKISVASNVESKEGNDRHHKSKKEHGTFRQKGSMDSSHVKFVNMGPSQISEPFGNIEQVMLQNQSVEPETNSAQAETIIFGSVSASIISNNTTAGNKAIVKDHGGTGRGKRHHPRGSKTGNDLGHESTVGETETSSGQSATPDVDLTRTVIPSRENRTLEERSSSHWQPKPLSNSANNQHGNRTAGTETVTTEINKPLKREHPPHKMQVLPRNDMEGGNVDQLQTDQSAPGTSVAEESVLGQDFNREKKAASTRGRPYSPNQDLSGTESSAVSNTDGQHEHNISSHTRRSGNHNNRAIRGRESRGDWSSGHDNRTHNMPAFRERQRQNVQNEYQPVGANKAGKPEKLEEPAEGNNNVGPRYREKGQNHSRRGGNYYRRQTGAVGVDSAQD